MKGWLKVYFNESFCKKLVKRRVFDRFKHSVKWLDSHSKSPLEPAYSAHG